MDAIDQKQINFRFDILPRNTRKALDFLSLQKWLLKSNWYLAGGTALALVAGHRKSFDLDFFNRRKNFSTKVLIARFLDENYWKTKVEDRNTVFGELFGSKISFIAYPLFIPKEKFLSYRSVKILSPNDIAVMKIIAISQRGRKRDFFDLYWCVRNLESLEDVIKRLKSSSDIPRP